MADTVQDAPASVVGRTDFPNATLSTYLGHKDELWLTAQDVSGAPSGDWVKVQVFAVGSVREQVEEGIESLAQLPPNWDSYGAPSIQRRVIRAAKQLARDLPEELSECPAVVPMSTGTLQFEWDVGPRALELELESSGRIHYLKWDPEHHVEEEGVYPIADRGRTVDLIRWVCGDA